MNPTWQGDSACDQKQQSGQMRTGSVSLMLVLVLAVLIGTFAVSLSSRAAQQRRATQHHQLISLLESAIDAVDQANFADETQLRLPVDEAAWQEIVVERISQPGDKSQQYTATQYKGDVPGISIQRTVSVKVKVP